ncbi:hypothetical protein D9M70_590870 [compost metagenome]
MAECSSLCRCVRVRRMPEYMTQKPPSRWRSVSLLDMVAIFQKPQSAVCVTFWKMMSGSSALSSRIRATIRPLLSCGSIRLNTWPLASKVSLVS